MNDEIVHQLYSINEIRDMIENEDYFLEFYRTETASFETNSNPKIASYLKEKALKQNDENNVRTYLIIDTPELKIIGYFCIKVINIEFDSNVSNKTKKKISSSAAKNNSFPALLITKLARNDNYKGIVDGNVIMEYALSIGQELFNKLALRHICVDWFENEKLKTYYCDECGFEEYQVIKKKDLDGSDVNLVSAFYKYS
ncbi:hypothetical protein ACMGE9_02555 [Macrococcus sp. EM39E]|uniref:hypothetical protein n=1 Tax=Macrococcus animalis TaxID=3395467 RepID=UPI0039BE46BC